MVFMLTFDVFHQSHIRNSKTYHHNDNNSVGDGDLSALTNAALRVAVVVAGGGGGGGGGFGCANRQIKACCHYYYLLTPFSLQVFSLWSVGRFIPTTEE